MILVEHGPVVLAFGLILLVLITVLGWRVFRQRTRPSALRFVAAMAAFSSLTVLLVFCVLSWLLGWRHTDVLMRSASPDKRHIAVLRHWQAGREGTFIDLYSHGGLMEETVGSGKWRAFHVASIRWRAADNLELTYDPTVDKEPLCSSTKSVQVFCVASPSRNADRAEW